jgi:hypothetical protein
MHYEVLKGRAQDPIVLGTIDTLVICQNTGEGGKGVKSGGWGLSKIL